MIHFTFPESFNIKINEDLPNYKLICNLFDEYNINYITWKPGGACNPVTRFYLGFGDQSSPDSIYNCGFENIYNLVYILKDFGLGYIHTWTKQYDDDILIGSLQYLLVDEKFWDEEPMSILDFLKIDPKSNIKDVFSKYFVKKEVKYSKHNNEYDDENMDDYSYEEDYEKDTFDTMTDGQLGSYDDFDGDIGDVMTWSGRD